MSEIGAAVSESPADLDRWLVEIFGDSDEAIRVLDEGIDLNQGTHGSSFTSGFFDALEWCSARRDSKATVTVEQEAHEGFTVLHNVGDATIVADEASFTAGFMLGVSWYDDTLNAAAN